MAVNVVVWAHDHKWKRWPMRVPNKMHEIKDNVMMVDSMKWILGYKCWRCLALSEDGLEKRGKGYDELKDEYEALKRGRGVSPPTPKTQRLRERSSR